MSRRQMTLASRLLLVAAVAIIVGGLIYDGTRAGEDPNLAPLYFVAVALGLVAMMLGYQARRTGH